MSMMQIFRCPLMFRSFKGLEKITTRGYNIWGHTTLEEKEAAKIAELEKNMILKWHEPNKALEETDDQQSRVYLPARIKEEENAMFTMSKEGRFSLGDYYHWVRQPFFSWFTDPTFHAWKSRIKAYQRLILKQSFDRNRLITLGPDLSAAHFLISRGCRVKFLDKDHWFQLDGKRMPDDLPDTYIENWYIEKIDASGTFLIYEGLQNIRNLICLKELDLSKCPLIDVWCMDRITGEFADTLEVLNLSGCISLDWNGLECIWRLRRLKRLILREMDHVQDLKLICLMLLEIFPDLDIQGVDYIDRTLLLGTPQEHLLKSLDEDLALLPEGSTITSDERASDKNDLMNEWDTTTEKNKHVA